MKLVLHIGAAKTGSTSIQEFLFRNVSNLKEKGFHLLQSPGGYNNRALAAMCMRRDRFVGFYRYNHVNSVNSKNEFDARVLQNMERELSEASNWAHTVISTSEDYYGGLLEIGEIEKLRDRLQKYFSGVKVILYVRSQVETLSSLYSTFLKNGDAVTLDNFVSQRCLPDSNVYNFYKGAESWSQVFGRENMYLRLFDRSNFDNGDLLQDFSNQLEVGLFSALSERIQVKNQSLTPLGQKLALVVNQRVPAFSVENGWNATNRWLIWLLSRFCSGKGASLDSKTTAIVEEMFFESNAQLHAEYFGGHKKLFSSARQNS